MPLMVLEGMDGCGKSTQFDLLVTRCRREGVRCSAYRDPGGTRLGERQRELLLDPANRVCPVAELFGYLQSRAQLVDECLRPALAIGELVVLDRFYHSTIIYQGLGLGLDLEQVRSASELCVGEVHPDLVCYYRVDPHVAHERRLIGREGDDRIEGRGLAYLERVHAGYERLAAEGCFRVLDGEKPIDALHEDTWGLAAEILKIGGL